MTEKVVLGLSGGVDSSVAALLLKEAGYEVLGLTLLTWREEGEGAQDAADAAAVCQKLGIRHEILDLRDAFYERVVSPFIAEYERGRTPNPCVRCNEAFKFPETLRFADHVGARLIATGHYGGLVKKDGRFLLTAAPYKDQSYALYGLSQETLSRLLLPLSGLKKEEVRALSRAHGLPVSDKGDSQDICFAPKDYPAFILRHSARPLLPGPLLSRTGEVLGTHRGIIHYTVGQRKGLGAFSRPMFVYSVDGEQNTVTLSEKGEEVMTAFTLSTPVFQAFESPPATLRCAVKIRYAASPAPATVETDGKETTVRFDTPQRAITPGQSAVFYDGALLLGGGVIDKILY